jgi:hypothetical protein
VGDRAGGLWLPGVCDQPEVGVAVPGTALDLGSEKRCRGRVAAGGPGAHRRRAAPSGGRGQPRCGGCQGTGPGLPADDLGSSPQRAAAAQPAARVLSRCAGRLRRPVRAGHPGAAGPRADPQAAARLSKAQITAALKRARRCHVADKAAAIQAALRAPQLAQPPELAAAYAAAVVALTKVIAAFSEQIAVLEQQVSASFRQHPSARIYLSQPGLGPRLAARLLGEFGDDPHRYASAKGRKNYAATSPITRASGKRKQSWPGTPATPGSPTPSTGGRSAR